MAKKNIKKKDEVAKYDQFEITNCDDYVPQFEVQKTDLEKIDIKSLIRVIQGQKVILDFDLAMLYGVETKSLNQSVKRNLDRFPDDFMFQLTKIEWNLLRPQIAAAQIIEKESITSLRSQIVTSNKRGGTRYAPYAFTNNGIGMLSSVLRSKTAIEVNKRIMRAFTAIPDLINNTSIQLRLRMGCMDLYIGLD